MGILTNLSTKALKGFEKETTKIETQKLQKRLYELQDILFAENKRSILIVLQGLDASGKDGAVKNVFSGVNPMGCKVQAFKKPTEEELGHDFLWRIHQHTPRKGMIQIFNRSHYEDVLVPRVHRWIDMKAVKKRYQYINAFENCLIDNGTLIFKFYLHISQEEQKIRFDERQIHPEKKWKYQEADLKEAALWNEYREAFEDIFKYCNEIPWQIVPADQNWYRNYIVAETIVTALEKLKMKYPEILTKELP